VSARLEAGGYEQTADHVAGLAKLSLVQDGAAAVASVPIPGGTIEILPGGEFDPAAAERKLAAERTRLEQEIERSRARLANEGFVAKAPPQIVQAERDKLARLDAELQAL
jgi:valyl-tRNA synthetase